MEIRFAKPEDTLGILALLEQIGKVHYHLRPDMFQADAQKFGASQVLARMANPSTPIFVAAEGEKVLGYSFCEIKSYCQHPVIADHTTLYLEDLCIDESCRGQGIGERLYSRILDYAREKNCYNLTLNVWSCNPGAMHFYEKMGMKPQRVYMETILEEK